MNMLSVLCGVLLCLISSAVAFGQGTRLLRHPTVSRDLVAFEYAGDLWVVAERRASAPSHLDSGSRDDPYFSPDGSQIAFTATVAGNTDVYVVPTAGGDPKRLTYHPGTDRVRGWTPDGRRVVFASGRTPRHSSRTFGCGPSALTADCLRRCRCRARSAAPIPQMDAASLMKNLQLLIPDVA